MAYTRINFTDRVVQFIRRYRDQLNNQYTFTPDEGTITNAGTALNAGNLNAIDFALFLLNNTFVTAGSANAYTVAIAGVTAMTQLLGVPLKLKTNFAITGACTVNVQALGAYAIRQDVSVAMATGDIGNGQIIIVVWDGTYFQFMGEAINTVTTTRTQALANKTLTAAKLAAGGFIADANGNELLVAVTPAVTTPVNEIVVTNAAAGRSPGFATQGADANINFNVATKGSGMFTIDGSDLVHAAAKVQGYKNLGGAF